MRTVVQHISMLCLNTAAGATADWLMLFSLRICNGSWMMQRSWRLQVVIERRHFGQMCAPLLCNWKRIAEQKSLQIQQADNLKHSQSLKLHSCTIVTGFLDCRVVCPLALHSHAHLCQFLVFLKPQLLGHVRHLPTLVFIDVIRVRTGLKGAGQEVEG